MVGGKSQNILEIFDRESIFRFSEEHSDLSPDPKQSIVAIHQGWLLVCNLISKNLFLQL